MVFSRLIRAHYNYNIIQKLNNSKFNLSNKLMSVLTQKFNPVTGKMEWEMQDENYDFQQEIARSGYADMVHDTERNQKYYEALKLVISQMKRDKIPVKVLDIGTGTGLLSMMAVKCGADRVTACEAFDPMAKCALEVIKKNGMEDKIKIVNKRSTELTVGPGCDLETKCNLLVTEVFDTELIGEGALSTFQHAWDFLLEPNSKIIPSIAKVYAQLIESPLIMNWHHGKPFKLSDNELIMSPKEVTECSGSAALHDIQMSQLKQNEFKVLSEPIIVNYVDFTGKERLIFKETCLTKANAIADGKCQAIFMWWDLEMTPGGDILSCAPYWAHPTPKQMQWRDHWMQAIYYVPKPVKVQQGQPFHLGTHHDEYSYWFSIHGFKKMKPIRTEPPHCICGLHANYSRTRIGMMNDEKRNLILTNSLKKIINPDTVIFCLGEGIIMAILAAKLGAKLIYVSEPNNVKRTLLKKYIKTNNVESKIKIFHKEIFDINQDQIDQKVDLILGEPWFSSSVLPWDNIHFWYLKSSVSKLTTMSPSVRVSPLCAIVKGVAVQFEDLWKIRAPVGDNVEGFDLTSFDDLIKNATDISDPELEPHPLWEYPCKALTSEFEIISFDFSKDINEVKNEIVEFQVQFESSSVCNAIALWVDYDFNPGNFSTGPETKIIPGEIINWYRYSHQAVYFMEKPTHVSNISNLKVKAGFKPKDGDTSFKFTILA